MVNLYWKKFNEGQVEINDFNNPNGVLVNREKVNKFLKWYSKFDAKRRADEKKKWDMMASSKSMQVIDLKELQKPSPEFLEAKKLFKQKIHEYLDL